MTLVPWKLQEHLARLKTDRFAAEIDLARVSRGLVGIRPGNDYLAEARLLAVMISSTRSAPDAADVPLECYIRGADLTAFYGASADRPVSVGALWRFCFPTASDRFIATVELIVSVETDKLDSRPELVVQSAVPASETLRLVDIKSAKYEALESPPDQPIGVQSDQGCGCFLFRLQDAELTYTEMIYPADFRKVELARCPQSAGQLQAGGTGQIRYSMFGEPLEKGVIRQARVRGVFLPRDNDLQLATECYADFSRSEPPLSC